MNDSRLIETIKQPSEQPDQLKEQNAYNEKLYEKI